MIKSHRNIHIADIYSMRRYRQLILFVCLILMLLLAVLLISERMIRHIDSKAPEVGLITSDVRFDFNISK